VTGPGATAAYKSSRSGWRAGWTPKVLEGSTGGLTCASKHTFYTDNATLLACKDLKKKILDAAARELDTENLETANGRLYVTGQPERALSYAELKARGYDMTGVGLICLEMRSGLKQ
jgi:CO/xanthine dehydrogenase Mo-binding subunit